MKGIKIKMNNSINKTPWKIPGKFGSTVLLLLLAGLVMFFVFLNRSIAAPASQLTVTERVIPLMITTKGFDATKSISVLVYDELGIVCLSRTVGSGSHPAGMSCWEIDKAPEKIKLLLAGAK